MTANEIKFRASGNGYLMVEPRSKGEVLSEGTKTHLIDVFVSEYYKRREEHYGKMLDKGNACEEDSITLLSRVMKINFKKNEVHLNNEYIKGTPDLYLGKSIHDADEIFDTKTSWSAHTFFRAQKESLNKIYYWQGQSYMWLTGAKKHTVAYCLVNGTADIINDEKRKLAWRLGIIDDQTEEYIEKCKQIEINHIFDLPLFREHYPHFQFHSNVAEWCYDIPKEKRVHTFSFERNEEDIERLTQKIIFARAYIAQNFLS